MFAPYRPVAFTGLTDPTSPTPKPAREQPPRVVSPPASDEASASLCYGMRIPDGHDPSQASTPRQGASR